MSFYSIRDFNFLVDPKSGRYTADSEKAPNPILGYVILVDVFTSPWGPMHKSSQAFIFIHYSFADLCFQTTWVLQIPLLCWRNRWRKEHLPGNKETMRSDIQRAGAIFHIDILQRDRVQLKYLL